MLYELFRYLDTLDLPGSGLFSFITFRAGATFILSLFIATIIGSRIIDKLRNLQIGEVVRDLGLEGENEKKGTPTMGGIIIIISILVPCLLMGRLDNIYLILMFITTLWMGTLGFIDDYIKVFKKNKEGMSGKWKIIGQAGLGIVVGLTLYLSPDVVIRENTEVVTPAGEIEEVEYTSENIKSTKTTIPFFKNNNLDYADLVPFLGEHAQTGGWIIFILLTIIVVMAVSNGANLTDGLDGLATGTSSIIGLTLGIFAYLSGHMTYAAYLNIMYIPGSEELVIFASAFMGATIGFLWYNASPAQVFMGDTGSLTLGGIIAVFALCIHKELLIPLLCGIFLVEALSVIVQRFYFKYTKKKYGEGRRILKMAPLHHHFQKPGNGEYKAYVQRPYKVIKEQKIVVRFWIVGIMLAALTIITLKMR